MKAWPGAAALLLGCGAAGPPPVDGPDGPTAASAGPYVVRTEPAEGKRGVRNDAGIKVHFSRSMDRASTEAAFTSPQIGEPLFSWEDDGKTLVVRAAKLLPWADGGLSVPPARVDFALGTGATAETAPLSLAPFASHFFTERVVTMDLTSDYALDGYVRYDDSDSSCVVDTAEGALCVGDSEVLDFQYKGLLTFSLTGLPDGITEILEANLSVYQYKVGGDPYATLGALELEHCSYREPKTAFRLAALDQLGILSREAGVGWKSPEEPERLKAALEEDYEKRATRDARAQFRLVFKRESDEDQMSDVAKFYPARIALSTDPDKRTKAPHMTVTFVVP